MHYPGDNGGRDFSAFGSTRRSGPSGPCYAFQRGECDRGDSCRFSHEAGGAASSGPPAARGVCYSFQKGECTRGDSCRFSHEASA